MTVNRQKSIVRRRGSHTHGWGSMKKHRGSGNRGGFGRAGTGKRGDAMKPSHWKTRYFGKFGFVNHSTRDIPAINIRELEQQMDALVARKIAAKEGDAFAIDLAKIGVHKLLGTGKATKKLNITVRTASARAKEKVAAAGGKVISAASQ